MCECSYFDRAQYVPSPALNCDVWSVHVDVHLDQAGILQGYDEVIAQRQRPLQLEGKTKQTQSDNHIFKG